MRQIAIAIVLSCLLAACSPRQDNTPQATGGSSLPARILFFEGEAYAGGISVNYNGNHIDHLQLHNADGEMLLHAAPTHSTDSLFTCQWRWPEGSFEGTWSLRPNGNACYTFDEAAPIRRIETHTDSLGQLTQVVFVLDDETLELTGFSYVDGKPMSCTVLDASDYTRPGGRLNWSYDGNGRLVSLAWTAHTHSKSWRAEVEYTGSGAVNEEVWSELERCAWFPMPMFAQRLGL